MRYDLTTIGEGQIRLTCERGDRLAARAFYQHEAEPSGQTSP